MFLLGTFLLVVFSMVFPALCVSAILLEAMQRVGPTRTWIGLAVMGVALAGASQLGRMQGGNAAIFAVGIGVIAGVVHLLRGRARALFTWVAAALAGVMALGVRGVLLNL